MVLIIVALIAINVQCKQVIYSYSASSQITNGWTTYSELGGSTTFSSCNSVDIFGGINNFNLDSQAMLGLFDLPPHYRLYVDLTFYRIDSWDPDTFNVIIDDQLIYQESLSSTTGTQLCGDGSNDEIIEIQLEIPHNMRSVAVVLRAINSGGNDESWGFSAFNINIDSCPPGCLHCYSGLSLDCQSWNLQYFQWIKAVMYTDSWDSGSPAWDTSIFNYFCTQQTYISRYIYLPEHNIITIQFRVWIWFTDTTFFVYSNGQLILTETVIRDLTIHSQHGIIKIENLQHTDKVLQLRIERTNEQWIRIRDLEVFTQREININKLSPGCLNLLQGNCWECESGWVLDDISAKCVPFCGDEKITSNEQCDDGNTLIYDGCHQGQFSCIPNCGLCQFGHCKYCKIGYYLIDNSCQSESHELQNAYQCESGWSYDLVMDMCFPICGDQILVDQEQCDNGNNLIYDGCYQCQFQCIPNCGYCLFGICSYCLDGYFLVANQCESDQGSLINFYSCDKGLAFDYMQNTCLPICGDKILVGNEQCDDGNNSPDDGCYECQFRCQGNCIKCDFGSCNLCDLEYQFDTNSECKYDCGGLQLKPDRNQCDIICGDMIINQYYEQCDDGNDQEYDGCYQCQYQCQKNCKICADGVCYDECPIGTIQNFYHDCDSICGNEIVTDLEECDDGNNVEFDGCFQCKYSCPQFCDNCLEGFCFNCLENYVLNKQVCELLNIMSDNYIECDDQNSFPNDGCFQFLVEQNWICNTAIPCECSYQVSPYMIVQFLNSSYSTQYVSIYFSEQVYSNQRDIVSKTMIVSVSNLSEQDVNITILPTQEITNDLSVAEYQVIININQRMEDKPILTINLNNQVFNQYDILVEKTIQSINLNIPEYLNERDKKYVEQLVNLNSNIKLTLGVFSLISIFLGESFIFQEILYILQYQEYLKYINVNYPQNLLIFFQFSDLLSIQPLLTFFNVNGYLNLLAYDQKPLPSKGKFYFYQQDADLISNLSCQIWQLIALLLLGLLSKMLKLIFYKLISNPLRYFYQLKKLSLEYKTQIFLQINNSLYNCLKQIFSVIHNFSISGFKNLLLLNELDILCKTWLYFRSITIRNIRSLVQNILAVAIVLCYLLVFLSGIKRARSNLNFDDRSEIRIQTITFLKHAIFSLILVFFQDQQVIQTISIFLINLGYFIIILFSQSQKGRLAKLVKIVTEGAITAFTFTTIIYFSDFQAFSNSQFKLNTGFAHIIILSLALVCELSKFVIQKGKELIIFIKKKIKISFENAELKSADHTLQFIDFQVMHNHRFNFKR